MVLATEKKQKSILYDDSSIHKIELITKNIGMVYSGMGPDYRYVDCRSLWQSGLLEWLSFTTTVKSQGDSRNGAGTLNIKNM